MTEPEMPDRVYRLIQALRMEYSDKGVDYQYLELGRVWKIYVRGLAPEPKPDDLPRFAGSSLVTISVDDDKFTADFAIPIRGILRRIFTADEYRGLNK